MDLRAQGVVVEHARRRSLADVSAAFAPGTRALVLGRAGAGKTLLLKVLAGLVLPSRGQVLWAGEDVAGLSPARRRERQAAFGMVFQTDALFDSLSVLDNVLMPLRRRHVPEDQALARGREVLQQVGLAHAERTLPENLSGGMRKRVGLARALAARPSVLLADDPFAGLDPGTARQVAEVLLEVAGAGTLLVAAPEPPPELPFARWLLMREGSLVHDGPPSPQRLEELEALP